jgi:hypothetical protein
METRIKTAKSFQMGVRMMCKSIHLKRSLWGIGAIEPPHRVQEKISAEGICVSAGGEPSSEVTFRD